MTLARSSLERPEFIRRRVIFVIESATAVLLLSRLGLFFVEQDLRIEHLYLQVDKDGTGTIIVHCLLEHDRARYIGQRLRGFPAATRVDWLEQRQH